MHFDLLKIFWQGDSHIGILEKSIDLTKMGNGMLNAFRQSFLQSRNHLFLRQRR